jgi:glycosyltransferase involved in cell wall biosynthesis
MKPTVIFVTQDFGTIENGPGIFAHYLWQHFTEHRLVEYYVFCASSVIHHPNIISLQLDASRNIFDSARRYLKVCSAAERFARSRGGKVVVHFNSAFTNGLRRPKNGHISVIGQVNDYEAAFAIDNFNRNRRLYGWKRATSLLLRHRQEAKAIREQNLTICNSRFTRRMIQDKYRFAGPENTEVIYKSVDCAFFEGGVRGEMSVFRIAFVGNDWERKGLQDLLEAINMTHAPVQLFVAGPSHESNQVIRNLVNKAGLSNCVQLLGKVDRVGLKKLLYTSDVFVLPSHGEALGVSVIEALASGIPAICYRVGGLTEIVTDGYNGYLLEEGDTRGLANRIDYLAERSSLRLEMGVQGRESVKRFSKEYMLQRYEDIYLSC